MRVLAILVVSLVIGVASSCGPSTTVTPIASTSGAPCPITTSPPAPVSPPPSTGTEPNPTLTFTAGPGSFLYGNDTLIVTLPKDGTVHPSDPERGLAGGVKFPWWRVARGALTVTTMRLDAEAASLPADVPGGYGERGFQVSGLNFPAPGCWQVTGAVGTGTLTFVVIVAAR